MDPEERRRRAEEAARRVPVVWLVTALAGWVVLAVLLLTLVVIFLVNVFAAGEEDLDALAAAALEEWGVGGMTIDIDWAGDEELVFDGRVHVGAAWPSADLHSCRVRIHAGLAPRDVPGAVLHEVGHCVGAYGHSSEPGSAMQPGVYEGTRVTDADRRAAKASRDRLLRNELVIAGVGR